MRRPFHLPRHRRPMRRWRRPSRRRSTRSPFGPISRAAWIRLRCPQRCRRPPRLRLCGRQRRRGRHANAAVRPAPAAAGRQCAAFDPSRPGRSPRCAAAAHPNRARRAHPAQPLSSGRGAVGFGRRLRGAGDARSAARLKPRQPSAPCSAKYPTQLGGHEPIVRRADLGTKGVYYRALVGPFASMEQAAGMCSSLKAAGGTCIVQRN